jgi:hypothetical protein
MANLLEEARASLERVQNFNTVALPRERDLGSELNFSDAVDPAKRIIDLFRQFPIQYLADLPPNRQTEIKSQSDSFFNILTQIQKFDPKTSDPSGQRSIINTLKNQYQPYFDSLCQLIAYGSSRLRDFGALEREARAAMQSVSDRATELTKELGTKKKKQIKYSMRYVKLPLNRASLNKRFISRRRVPHTNRRHDSGGPQPFG